MRESLPVYVFASDPVCQAGLAAQLRGRPEAHVVEDADEAVVAVVGTDEVDVDVARTIKAVQRNGCPRVVVVAGRLDDAGVLAAVEAGACGLLRRAESSPEHLSAAVVSAAAGDGSVPPDLLGRLLEQVARIGSQVLGPRGITLSGLSTREIEVLRLAAEGCETAEIAKQLCYSERTVKNVIHDITTRLQLRNRSHAVAFALRAGLI
jgi:DNA-binding NarL/FixJ family response regulator